MQLFSHLRTVEDWVKSSSFIIFIGAFVWFAAGCNGSGGGQGVIPAPSTFPQPEMRESSGGKSDHDAARTNRRQHAGGSILGRPKGGPYPHL